MAHRLLAAITRAFTDDSGRTQVHFHQGASVQPAACFDERCVRPRMEVHGANS